MTPTSTVKLSHYNGRQSGHIDFMFLAPPITYPLDPLLTHNDFLLIQTFLGLKRQLTIDNYKNHSIIENLFYRKTIENIFKKKDNTMSHCSAVETKYPVGCEKTACQPYVLHSKHV